MKIALLCLPLVFALTVTSLAAPKLPKAPKKTPQERLETLKTELNLTPAQVAKIEPIFKTNYAAYNTVRQNPNLSAEQKKEKKREMLQATMEQVRPILTLKQQLLWKKLHPAKGRS